MFLGVMPDSIRHPATLKDRYMDSGSIHCRNDGGNTEFITERCLPRIARCLLGVS